MIDPRDHPTDGLWLPGLNNFQGPALLSWNNAEFSDEDWGTISKIYQSLKDKDPMKVGRFGLGFISVYHITGKWLHLYILSISVLYACINYQACIMQVIQPFCNHTVGALVEYIHKIYSVCLISSNCTVQRIDYQSFSQ